jgi:hypothetical protein
MVARFAENFLVHTLFRLLNNTETRGLLDIGKLADEGFEAIVQCRMCMSLVAPRPRQSKSDDVDAPCSRIMLKLTELRPLKTSGSAFALDDIHVHEP